MLFSLTLIFLSGIVLGSIFNRLKLPQLLGMLLTGIILGPYLLNLLDPKILSISTDLRQIALIIILTRAGLNLDINDLKKVGSYFINKGVEKVYISLGARGVFYMNEEKNGIIAPPKINVVSTNGAGDAFVAGIAYGEFNKFDIEKSTRYGVAASALTALDINTITEKMNIKNIESIMEEME